MNRTGVRTNDNNSRAIEVLCEIMTNSPAPVRRIEAAEQLLDYEAPQAIVELAKAALASIFEDSETPDDIRLDALKLIRKAEARKIVPARAAVRDEASHVEHRRLMETLERKAALIDAGVWPLPKGWDADLNSPDYVPMPTPDYDGPTDPAEALREARLAHMRKVAPDR